MAPRAPPVPDPRRRQRRQALALLVQGLTAWHLYRTCARVARRRVRGRAFGGRRRRLARRAARQAARRRARDRHGIDGGEAPARAGAGRGRGDRLRPRTGLARRLLEANGGQPVDVVFDIAGGRVFDAVLEALAPFGPASWPTASPRASRTRCAPAGCCAARARRRLLPAPLPGAPGDGRRGRWPSCSTLVARGELRASIGETYPLSEAAPAHEDLRRAAHDRQAHAGPPSLTSLPEMTTFADLGLSEPLLQALRDVGYESPSPIQEQAIPPLLEGRDVIGQAQTGTGKTAAFGLPLLRVRRPVRPRGPGARPDADARAVHPGHAGAAHLRRAQGHRRRGRVRRRADPHPAGAAARRAAQVVVGTVGRVLDLISRHSLMLHACRYLVLDEADEMLDLGLPRGRREDPLARPRQPPDRAVQRDDAAAIRRLAERHMYDPVTIKVKAATLTIDTVEQFFARGRAGATSPTALVRVLRGRETRARRSSSCAPRSAPSSSSARCATAA